MDITYLLLNYPPERFIGAELAAHRLVKWLAGQGHKVNVRTIADGTHRFDGVHARAHRDTPLAATDIVITNAGLSARAAQSYPNTPRVVWAHNNELPSLYDIKDGNPSLVVANTDHMQQVLLSATAQRACVLYPPLGPPPPATEVSEGGHFLLINGTASKGGELVYDLAERLQSREFVVVEGGHGPQVDFSDLANVRVVPQGNDLEQAWQGAAALLVPSRLESYSMSGVEALTRGVPVVAHSLPGVCEALGGAGTYVDRLELSDWLPVLKNWPEGRHYHYRSRMKALVEGRRMDVELQMLELEERMLELVGRG